MTDDRTPILLLIDDSPEVHRLLEVRLRSEDLTIRAVGNGAEGIELAGSLLPDLILLDLHMPGMDGFQVLRRLKEDPTTVEIPVIVISGNSDTENKVRGLDLGAIDYVCKPFNLSELKARVRAAMRISHLMRLLAQRAQIDGLTGLWNRQYFDERLTDEIGMAERNGDPLSLALCDLDHFKSLNDTYGHAAGDATLQGFARILVANLRQHDVACRYGGEEFGLILRETSAEDAASLMNRIREVLAGTDWPRHPDRRVTASFGVCRCSPAELANPNRNQAVLAMIERADRALYAAKQSGRNRVVIDDEGSGRASRPRLAPTG